MSERAPSKIIKAASSALVSTAARRSDRKPRYYCTYCKRSGHLVATCFTKRDDDAAGNHNTGLLASGRHEYDTGRNETFDFDDNF